jgi:hypothetical protein
VPDALFVDGFFNSRRVQIATMAARDRVPASYSVREYVEVGGLTSYGTNLEDMIRQVLRGGHRRCSPRRRGDRMNEANEAHIAASAIATVNATQLAFVALVKKGILSKIEAEEILRQAIGAIKTASTTDQAAELLAGILERLSKFKPGPRQ